MHRPWKQLFHDYNLAAGRVWTLILLWIGIAPYLFFRSITVPKLAK